MEEECLFFCFFFSLPLSNTYVPASNLEPMTRRRSPKGKFSASFPQLAAAGREGSSWAPAQDPGTVESVSGGPREQEKRDTAAQGRLEAGAPALRPLGLPGQRDGGHGWEAGVRAGGILPTKLLTGTTHPGPGPCGQWPCSCVCGRGPGCRHLPPASGARASFQRPSWACFCLASLPLVTSLWGTSKCKMQKPGPTIQPRDPLWLGAQAALPPGSTPGSHRPDPQKVRPPGLPWSTGEASSGAQCRSWGEAGGMGGRTDVCSWGGRVGRTAGRFSLHSATASFRRGASAPPHRGALAGAGRAAGQGPEPVFALASPARPVLRTPGGAELSRPSLAIFWAARLPGNPAATGPPCESHDSLWDKSLLVGTEIHPLAPNRSSGHKGSSIPQRPLPRASGALAQGRLGGD